MYPQPSFVQAGASAFYAPPAFQSPPPPYPLERPGSFSMPALSIHQQPPPPRLPPRPQPETQQTRPSAYTQAASSSHFSSVAPAQAASIRPPDARKNDGVPEQVDSRRFDNERQNFKQTLGVLRTNANSLGRTDRRRLKTRIDDSYEVLNKHMVGANNFVYRMQGAPAGLMSVSVPEIGNVKIQGIVTRPDTKGVGGALIEQAVAIAMHHRRGGMVELQYLPNSGAKQAYEALGFTWIGGLTMVLDPSKSAKWAMEGGDWKLQKPPPRMIDN